MPKIESIGEKCCGCGACAPVCPKSCIEMEPDRLGFWHPVIDGGACIGCGACDRTCPVLSSCAEDQVCEVWWARANDEHLRGRSSSGGIFGLLAQTVLEQGGIVYGAAFDDDFKAVRHIRIDSPKNLDVVMRSKYVQSMLGGSIYNELLEDLRAGRPVLFCGTACQVAGIYRHLNQRRAPMERLLLVDVICHGVPSPKLWSLWLEFREPSPGARVQSVSFRDKKGGWSAFSVKYSFRIAEDEKDHTEASVFNEDWYMRAFLQNASIRESCFSCPAKRSCGSDITLGDFWGIQTAHPEAFDDRGVSAVLMNTEKGIEAMDGLKGEITYGESSYDKVLAGNPSLVSSVEAYPRRKDFLVAVASDTPIEILMKNYSFEVSFLQRMVRKARRILGRVMRALEE